MLLSGRVRGGGLRGRQHISIGVGTTALAIGVTQVADAGVDVRVMAPSLVAAAIGSLGPDLDHPGSIASMSIPVTLITYGGVFLAARGWEASRPEALPIVLSAFGAEWVTGAWAAIAVGIGLIAVSMVLGAAFGHRGIVHSVAFGAGVAALVAVALAAVDAPVQLALPFAWGWLAHLLADAVTPAGLGKLLWPLAERS